MNELQSKKLPSGQTWQIKIHYGPDSITLSIRGDFEWAAATNFRQAVDLASTAGVPRILLDGKEIASLGAPAIWALGDAVTTCHERGVDLRMQLSEIAQDTLDRVGLWWLSLPGAALQSVDTSMKDAVRRYAELMDRRRWARSAPSSRRPRTRLEPPSRVGLASGR